MDANFPDVVLRPGGGRRTCRVLFSYSPQNEDELRLEVNDEIDFLEEVEEGWWRGKLRNKIGVFPSNFVCEISSGDEPCVSESEISAPLSSPDSAATSDDAPVLPPKPVKETCRVLFAYEAANDDELTIKKDDVITIITKEVEDKGWWKGELRGKIGLFPDNFVEMITSSEDVGSSQQKKPDRPSKTSDKSDSKIPLISSNQNQKKSQDGLNAKDQDEKIAGLKNEGPFIKKNLHNSEKSSAAKHPDKNLDLYQIKADTVASHRKSLELKANENQSPPILGKKPVLPPPISNKPKPASGKPNQVKRLSGEINDLIDGVLSKSTGNLTKRSSGDIHDLIDGLVTSKHASGKRGSGGSGNEDLDFDIVERSDMLTHITASRPKAPGRRPPSKDLKENEVSPLTNGNADANDKEKTSREREWEKNKPPWVDELKSNLKSTKITPADKMDKKSSSSGGPPKPGQSVTESFQSTNSSVAVATSVEVIKTSGSTVTIRQQSSANSGARAQSMFSETGSKVSELSSRFSCADKSKPAISASPPKSVDLFKTVNSTPQEQFNEDQVQVSKKEFLELKLKVEKLEKLLFEFAGQLGDEADKRRVLEKELNKLTDLVTQV